MKKGVNESIRELGKKDIITNVNFLELPWDE